MSIMRAELSKKNQYGLMRARRNELKYFCYQYKSWHEKVAAIDSMSKIPTDILDKVQTSNYCDPTVLAAEEREEALNKIAMVDKAAELADPIIAPFIIWCVTTPEMSYDKMMAKKPVPICRSNFYDRCHKFFWYLSELRR